MPTLEELEHKLRLVEASRRRLQCAPWSTYSRSDTSRQMMTQLTAQLRETEDALSREKAKNEMMQRSTAAEMADLRSKFAHLEDQKADIDALIKQNPSVASEIRKAYLTGKVEVQRMMRRSEKEIESLRSALHHAEEKSESAHGQMVELQTKYYETVRQKSSLYKHTQTLQQQVQDLQLQQAECVSSTIRNTQRAQQMSQRVMQTLAQADRRPRATAAGDGQVATLKAENAILHEVLQCTLPHLDPAANCLVSTVTGTMRKSLHVSSSLDQPSAEAATAALRSEVHGPEGAGQSMSAHGQAHQPDTHTSAASPDRNFSPVQDLTPAGEGLDMLTTLRNVLGGSDEPDCAEVTTATPGTDLNGAGDSSSASDWSGDDVMREASQTLRGLMPSTQAWPATSYPVTAGPPRRASQVHFSGSTCFSSGKDPSPATAADDREGDAEEECQEHLRLAKPVRRHRKGPKARRDTMELSRVPRLAARLRAPVHANSAVSFLQKLAKARTDGGLGAEPAEGLDLPADRRPPDELLLSGPPAAQPEADAVDGGDEKDDEMEKARAIMLAAVQRRRLGKLGNGKAAAAAADEATARNVSAVEASGVGGPVCPPPNDVEDQDKRVGPEPMTKAGGFVPKFPVSEEHPAEHVGIPTEQVSMPTEQVSMPVDKLVHEGTDHPNGIAMSGTLPMRMPDVHATSIAVANALRSIGSLRGRDHVRGHPPAALSTSFRARSLSRSPSSRLERGATPPLTSARLGQSRSPPRRSCSLSPQRTPPPRHKEGAIVELQAQTKTMAKIMNDHMPWMIHEVTRATKEKVATMKGACECQPHFSIPVLAQTAQKTITATAAEAHAVQHIEAGRLASRGGTHAAAQPGSQKSGAKAAGDKYAAALMQPGMWRPQVAANARSGGAMTLHPPASHGLRFQQSLHRNSSV